MFEIEIIKHKTKVLLIYINDIADNTTCETRLFADDGLLFRTIKSSADTASLQADIDSVAEWATKWQMRFNPTKCYVMRIYNGRSLITHNNPMDGHIGNCRRPPLSRSPARQLYVLGPTP